MLILDDDAINALRQAEVPFQQEIVVRHLLYFGPLPKGLLEHVSDEKWGTLFNLASEMAEISALDDPDARLKRWPKDVAPHMCSEAKDMVTKMTNLDPAARTTIDEVLDHPWWRMAV